VSLLRRSGLGILALMLAGCGTWIVEQPVVAPSPSPSVAPDADARAAVAGAFGLDPAALVATDDGFVFVVPANGELRLLLSRRGTTDRVEVLARVVDPAFPAADSGASSFAVVCPPGFSAVRYYLFGQDEREVTRVITGLTGVGGEVIDGLWVIAIADDEIAPERRWEIVDPLGVAGIESGTGARFVADGATIGLGDSAACEVNEH
jgi:hypothetical protein